MLLAICGFLMLFAILFLLFKSKTLPVVVFITIPVIAAFAAGFSIHDVVGFVEYGISKTSKMAVLFIFSVTFFGVMSDAGMFDGLVNKLVSKAGTNVVAVAVATAIIGIFSHLDGATVTTVLVTVPAMLPIYKKLNIRPHLLLMIVGCGMGVMNLLPWGGPVMREAIVLKMDAGDLWHILLPMQGAGIVATLALAVFMALKEKKFHGAGQVSLIEDEQGVVKVEEVDEEALRLKRPHLAWVNMGVLLLMLIVLVIDVFPTYFVFMVGCCVALLINYPDMKQQKARMMAHAPAAIDVSSVMLAAGIMVGVLSKSGMLEAMAVPLLHVIPASIAQYLHIIMGILAFPLGTMLGTDSYFYGLLPLAIEVGKNYGISGLTMAIAMLVGKNLALLISPLVPATFLGIGLANVELKEHIRYSFLGLWIVGLVMLVFAFLIGII
ncbi:CitMHS family transporter [Vibrio porteresiae]|uniref:Citrate:proton symporter n=1 Tax=Vibrio porteresiae DSM 19223 TaxID=1123496 RepID=A0ABZ0QAI9_9VIBR|nr:citrate:proton symporter [Vibrio porteresiae]WPC73202.1 citrate:proton symporter [Vibrio porteresiae DSM 19223]